MAQSKKRKTVIPIWIFGIFFLLAGVTVWLRLFVIKTAYEINQTNKMLVNSEKEMEKIKLEIAELKAPKKLEELAKKKFQLERPSAKQVVHLSER